MGYNAFQGGDMVEIAIIEDCKEDFENIQNHIIKYSKDENTLFNITRFICAEDFLSAYRKTFDIIIFDIELTGIDGVEAAKRFRETDSSTPIIFTTNIAALAIQGYAVNAIDYLLKPVGYDSLYMTMKKAFRSLSISQNDSLMVSIAEGIIKIPISSIIYAEVFKHTLIYHFSKTSPVGSRTEVKCRGTIKDLEEKLGPHGFLRPSNSFLINPKYVDFVGGNEVTIEENIIPISRPRKKEFMKQLTTFFNM